MIRARLGNFLERERTNLDVHVPRILPASIRRAFALMKSRFLAIFADAPVVFFAVVFGVALTFRVAVGVAREATAPPVVAPTFVTTGPEPGLVSAGASASASPTASAHEVPKAEVGAAGRVQPLGSPSPARVTPRPRGHGRRTVPGGEH